MNGRVCAPEAAEIAAAINALAADRRRLPDMGAAGFERAKHITWTAVIDALLA